MTLASAAGRPKKKVVTPTKPLAKVDPPYTRFLDRLADNFVEVTKAVQPGGVQKLFTTDVTGLYDTFLSGLSIPLRQEYTCRACRHFVDQVGGLVVIDEHGVTRPALWPKSEDVPEQYQYAIDKVFTKVARANVTGVYFDERTVWGQPRTGDWCHMAVQPNRAIVYKATALKNAGQAMAEKREDFGMLQRSIQEFPVGIVRKAHTLLTNDKLYRSEKCIGVATWLLALHDKLATSKSAKFRANVVWQAVATAPEGFCHVRSGMIGTLLEDIQNGLAFADIKRKFDAKMNPTKYMRPTAAPAAGNLARAEKVVEQLRSSGALERRFAKLQDCEILWSPKPAKPKQETTSGPVFGHVKAKKPVEPAPQGQIDMTPVTMTFAKFQKTVLPDAVRIQHKATAASSSYYALVTSVNPDAPPIMKWDHPDRRNPVGRYTYTSPRPPSSWNIPISTVVDVTAVILDPSMWNGHDEGFPGHAKGVMFALKGAYDTRYVCGALFFPETLRGEYHEIRSSMEAFSKSGIIQGKEEAECCGPMLCEGEGQMRPTEFIVTSKTGAVVQYKIDRWD